MRLLGLVVATMVVPAICGWFAGVLHDSGLLFFKQGTKHGMSVALMVVSAFGVGILAEQLHNRFDPKDR